MVSSCLNDNSASVNASSNAYVNSMSSCMYSANTNPASGATYPYTPMNFRMDATPSSQYYNNVNANNNARQQQQHHLQHQQQQQQYLQQQQQQELSSPSHHSSSSANSSIRSTPPSSGTGAVKSPTKSGGSGGGKNRSSYKHIPHRDKPPHLVQRRNARERRRVQAVNTAFTRLRRHIPYENRNKRLSKVKTLKIAMDYIEHMRQMISSYDSKMLSAQHVNMEKTKWQTPYVEISPQAARDNFYSNMYGQV